MMKTPFCIIYLNFSPVTRREKGDLKAKKNLPPRFEPHEIPPYDQRQFIKAAVSRKRSKARPRETLKELRGEKMHARSCWRNVYRLLFSYSAPNPSSISFYWTNNILLFPRVLPVLPNLDKFYLLSCSRLLKGMNPCKFCIAIILSGVK